MTSRDESLICYEQSVTGCDESLICYEQSVASCDERLIRYEQSVTSYEQSLTSCERGVAGYGRRVARCDEGVTRFDRRLSIDECRRRQSTLSIARNACCGISTVPTCFMRFLPSFCFSRSLRLRLMSPP